MILSNCQCNFCGNTMYKSPSIIKNNTSGKYFCSNYCKNSYRGWPQTMLLPQSNPLYSAINIAYNMYNQYNSNGYITYLTLCNTIKHRKQLGDYMLVIGDRKNGSNILTTPKNIGQIKDYFYNNVKIADIVKLTNVNSNWKYISFINYRTSIEYEVEY